jgi:hypothetical protein
MKSVCLTAYFEWFSAQFQSKNEYHVCIWTYFNHSYYYQVPRISRKTVFCVSWKVALDEDSNINVQVSEIENSDTDGNWSKLQICGIPPCWRWHDQFLLHTRKKSGCRLWEVKNSCCKNLSPTEVKRTYILQNLSIFISKKLWYFCQTKSSPQNQRTYI